MELYTVDERTLYHDSDTAGALLNASQLYQRLYRGSVLLGSSRLATE